MNEGRAVRVIRVVVVGDEVLVRSGFELIPGASEDIEVVATAGGGDAVKTVRRVRPDVVLGADCLGISALEPRRH